MSAAARSREPDVVNGQLSVALDAGVRVTAASRDYDRLLAQTRAEFAARRPPPPGFWARLVVALRYVLTGSMPGAR